MHLTLLVLLLLASTLLYFCGLVAAYVAFLLNRRATVQSVRLAASRHSGVTAVIRPVRMTSFDHREAFLASSLWPVILVGVVVSPLLVACQRYLDGPSKAHLQRKPRLSGFREACGPSMGASGRVAPAQTSDIGQVIVGCRSDLAVDWADRRVVRQSPQVSYAGGVVSPLLAPAQLGHAGILSSQATAENESAVEPSPEPVSTAS
jgi:hypothetical protein